MKEHKKKDQEGPQGKGKEEGPQRKGKERSRSKRPHRDKGEASGERTTKGAEASREDKESGGSEGLGQGSRARASSE
eukprot:11220857-Alexandrium_andersonii.AAC.1